MPSEDVDTDEARRQRSEEARRAALRERIERQKARERQIAADIANVDKKATKRIVFEDSDEEEDDGNDGEEKKKSTSTLKSSSKRPKLFDSEDEKDDDDGEIINEKTLVNRHTGAKGEKLMKLESRFNADPRFKLDDKFAESDSDDGGDATLNAEKTEMKQEKDKNRELLSKILGKSVEEKKPKQTTDASGALLKARPFTRFDPENPEHIEWMKAFEAAKNPKSAVKSAEKTKEDKEENEEEKEEKEEENGEEEEEEKSDDDFEKADIFFKMDDQFATEMKERKETGPASTNGFSFLSMIGRKYEEKSDEEAETEEESVKTTKKSEKRAEKLPKLEKKSATASGPLLKTKPTITGAFFVDPSKDERIRSLAVNFRRTQTVEKIIDKWAPHRDAIFKLWKKQRRDAVKKQKDSFFTNGRQQRKRKIEEEKAEKTVEN